VRAIARLAARRRLASGERLFEQGEAGDAAYVVIAGAIRVSAMGDDEDEIVLALLGPGEAFGELALIDGAPRSAGAEAAEPSELLVILREPFLAWLASEPAASQAVMRTLTRRLRATNEALADSSFLDVRQGLAKQLLPLGAARDGARLVITQQQLAQLLGVTREAVNEALRRLEDEGVAELGRGAVTVADARRLTRATH